MNKSLRIILEMALETYILNISARAKRDAALDIIYGKLVLIPIQRAWRAKKLQRQREYYWL